MTKSTDDAYERAEAGVVVQTKTRVYYVDLGDLGDTVYLKNQREPLAGVITGIEIWPSCVRYVVRWGDGRESGHFPIELQDDKDL